MQFAVQIAVGVEHPMATVTAAIALLSSIQGSKRTHAVSVVQAQDLDDAVSVDKGVTQRGGKLCLHCDALPLEGDA